MPTDFKNAVDFYFLFCMLATFLSVCLLFACIEICQDKGFKVWACTGFRNITSGRFLHYL